MTDTGPPYPLPPEPGSNAIGDFIIGTSPIGTIGFNVWDTVISQYANSPVLTQIIQNFAEYFDQSTNFDAFFDMVWNIDTAQGWGLDVWGRILGISRILQVPSGDYFGFEEALPGSNPWEQQPFYAGQPATDSYALSDDAYRQLLLAKAAANICDGTIPAINQLLLNLFPGRGNCYVQEGVGDTDQYFGFAEAGTINDAGWNQAPFFSGDVFDHMKIRYIFEFPLSPVEFAIVSTSGVLPTPCGVSASIVTA